MGYIFVEGGYAKFEEGCEWGYIYNTYNTRVGKFNKVSGAILNYEGEAHSAAITFPPQPKERDRILEKYLAIPKIAESRVELG